MTNFFNFFLALQPYRRLRSFIFKKKANNNTYIVITSNYY